MRRQPDGTAVAPVTDGALRKPMDSVAVGQGTSSGDVTTGVTREASVASPRLIPEPESSLLSVKLPPEPPAEDTGQPSASFDRKCAP